MNTDSHSTICLPLAIFNQIICFYVNGGYRSVITLFDFTWFWETYPTSDRPPRAHWAVLGEAENMNNGYRNTQIRHFRNSKAPNIVRQVFRCCTYETVSFRTLSRLLYFILLDSSDTFSCKSMYVLSRSNCGDMRNRRTRNEEVYYGWGHFFKTKWNRPPKSL